MAEFVVEFLNVNRSGGLEDRETYVRAASPEAAEEMVQAKFPRAVIGHVEEAR